MPPEPNIIEAHWPAPSCVRAFCTTRNSGFSQSVFDSFNLAQHVGDDPEHVRLNRDHLRNSLNLPAEPTWLGQTHSTEVSILELDQNREVDAAVTRLKNTIAVIMTADCLPILLCNKKGSEVAAVHAGWRGLLSGVVEATLEKMSSPRGEVMAWIGPAINQPAFEVGAEVRTEFCDKHTFATTRFASARSDHWLCDLPGLASDILASLGVSNIYLSGYCSFQQASLFYSYRREGKTGRMASLIWINSKP